MIIGAIHAGAKPVVRFALKDIVKTIPPRFWPKSEQEIFSLY